MSETANVETAEKVSEAEVLDATLYLTFTLEGELLALDVSHVHEVLDLCPITRVPRTEEYLRGVINLRGSVIPVIDLRLRFAMKAAETTIDARIVVIELVRDSGETVVGILTDSVQDVLEINDDQIGEPPQRGEKWRTQYIRGIGKYDDRFILILDVDRVFADSDSENTGEDKIGQKAD